jgi:hypothetical protein
VTSVTIKRVYQAPDDASRKRPNCNCDDWDEFRAAYFGGPERATARAAATVLLDRSAE